MKMIFMLVALCLSLQVNANQALSLFYSQSDQFLSQWVHNGRVDYAGVKQNFAQIEKLYQQIRQMNLLEASEAEKKAFYINAYNLVVVYQVAKYYPLKSPMNQSGFFDKVNHTVAGEAMTLNELEIKELVLPYRDPRIHFALACAAKSCPELASFAYQPATLDADLEKRTRKAINDRTFIKVKSTDKTVEVSKIFDWYERDFTQDGQSTLGFINQYRTTKIPASYSVGYYEYNWDLNKQ